MITQAEHEPASCQTLIACGLKCAPRGKRPDERNQHGEARRDRSWLDLEHAPARVFERKLGRRDGVATTGGASGNGGVATTGGASGNGGAATTGGASGNGGAATTGGCDIFPADNPWNLDISAYPLNANSATYLSNMSPTTAFHPDWGTVSDGYGFPFSSGTGATPQPITWSASWGQSESDKLPCPSGTNQFCYPIPLTAPIEGGPSADPNSDRHVLYIDTAGAPSNCTLYELYNAQNPTGGSGWNAANGAIFHLGSNALRPDGWTSADAAGLPVFPGLVRYDETVTGRRDSPCHPLHHEQYLPGLHSSRHPRGGEDQTPRCHPWACACGSRPASTPAHTRDQPWSS
jgi:hypothetical protein